MAMNNWTRSRRSLDWLPPQSNQPLLKYITFGIEGVDATAARNKLLLYNTGLLATIALISFIISVVVKNVFSDNIYWINPADHALLESFAALISIFIGMILAWEYSASGKLNVLLLANAFFAIGILDFFHAFSQHCYNLFVWYHSSGTLLSSLLFISAVFTNYSNGFFTDHPKWARSLAIISGLSLIFLYAVLLQIFYMNVPEVLSTEAPHHTPVSIVKGKFSSFIYGVGHLSATLYLITGISFLRGFLKTNDVIYLIIGTSMFLFFLSDFFFVFSKLWDPLWWYWHCIKIMIFSGLLLGLAYGFTEAFHRLFNSREKLAGLVEETEAKSNELEETNITLKNTQRYLKESEKLASIGKMAAMMAHEIRNPLGAISNSVGVLKNYSLRSEENEEILTLIEDELARLNKITEDFLSFAKPSCLNKSEINLHKLLDETLSLLCIDKSTSPQIVLQRDFAPDIPLLLLDKNHIKQAFINILINSIQAIPKSGIINIRTRYKKNEGEVEVRFADTGIGISEDTLSKVFNPFFTTKDKGLGLGINIIHKIIKEHGGYILLASKEGHGTEIKLSFPVAPQTVHPDTINHCLAN